MARVRLCTLFAAALLALVACDAAVSAQDVETEAATQFSLQIPVDSVECPDDVAVEVGATTTCVLESEGQAYEMTAEVIAVDGSTAEFAFELTGEL